MSDTDTDSEGSPVSYGDPLNPSSNSDHILRHQNLGKLLGLPEDLPSLQHVFSTVASLCDPYTQPEENEVSILSLDFISDLVIAISYSNLKYTKPERPSGDVSNPEIQSLKFDLSLAYFTILQALLGGLNCDDELKLRYVNNDDIHWLQNLKQWTPTILDDYNLKLCYRMVCVLLMSIYKLFKPEMDPSKGEDGEEADQTSDSGVTGEYSTGYNLSTNPYLYYFIKTWKCQTNVILLGLEIDRRLESLNQEEGGDEEYVTPFIVHATLKGSSAIRYVVTWILNQNPSVQDEDREQKQEKIQDSGKDTDEKAVSSTSTADCEFDLKKESLINFVHPLARRKINGGALLIDMRLVIIALLITNAGYSMKPRAINFDKSMPQWELERKQNQAKPITELGDILIDLEYEDRFDEDIRYIFDFEYEDEWEDEADEDEDAEYEDTHVLPEAIEDNERAGKTLSQFMEKNIHKYQHLADLVEKVNATGEEREKAKEEITKIMIEAFEKVRLKPTDESTAPVSSDTFSTPSTAISKPTSGSTVITKQNDAKISTAVRSDDAIEFDELGRDWRDIPRGDNVNFQPWFLKLIDQYNKLSVKEKEDPEDIFSSWSTFEDCLKFLTLQGIEGTEEVDADAERKIGQSVLNTIAKAVKDEKDKKASVSKSDQSIANSEDDDEVTPDKIYTFWSSLASEEEISITQDNNKLIIPIFGITKYELLLHNNRKLAGCMLDEMLMCHGYRRVLIWFITHNINLCPALINYVFELLVGYRGGDGERQQPYKHSRQGAKIILSEIEELMLLHEFLSNSGFYLLATKDGVDTFYGYKIVLLDSIAKKYLSLMCLMIDQLINQGIIDLNPNKKDGLAYDYTYNLQLFLFTWIGKLPEARELFFRIKNATGEGVDDDGGDASSGDSKVKSESSLLEEESKYSESDYEALIKGIQSVKVSEVGDYLSKTPKYLSMIKDFAKRIEKHLKWLICTTDKERSFIENTLGPKSELHIIQQDFQFFLQNFNCLCKVEILAETLFSKLEKITQNGQIFEPLEQDNVEGVLTGEIVKNFGADHVLDESEFNDQFLDGVGQFSDKPTREAEETSGKKKKNKKKKKGKKK